MLFSKAYSDYNSVILHVHIPKSGGTSVRENLVKYFNDNQVLRMPEPGINHFIGNKINSVFESKEENEIKKWLKNNLPLIRAVMKIKNFSKNFFKKNNNFIFKIIISSQLKKNKVYDLYHQIRRELLFQIFPENIF